MHGWFDGLSQRVLEANSWLHKIPCEAELRFQLSVLLSDDHYDVDVELADKHHCLFSDQIGVTQSVDVNISLDVQARVHEPACAAQISEYEAALRLAEELVDIPEKAAMLR